jgi:hypothetical protein
MTPHELGNIKLVYLEGNEGLINTRFFMKKLFEATNGYQWKNRGGWFSKTYEKCYHFESKTFCYFDESGSSSCESHKIPPVIDPTIPVYYNEHYNCTQHFESDTNWECNFHGITCNKNELSIMDLSNNYLEGSIPSEIAGFNRLQEIHLEGNQLKGSIPPEFGNLDSLTNLGLSYNLLEGTIPQGVKNLLTGNLTTLKIQSNNIEDSLYIEEHKDMTVIADCGKTLTSDPLISCIGCSICCKKENLNLECIEMRKTFPLEYSPFSTNTKLPTFSLFAVFVMILSTVSSFFLSLFCLMVMRNKVKLVSSEVIQSFQEESVYKFLLSKNKVAVTIALFSILVQLLILYIFLQQLIIPLT